MGSKLKITFFAAGEPEQSITVFEGARYTFKHQRTRLREVTIGDAVENASSFLQAFKVDDNYLNQFKLQTGLTNVEGEFHSFITIEHPQEGFFNTAANDTTFSTFEVTATEPQDTPVVTATLTTSPTDPCAKIQITLHTSLKAGKMQLEYPTGNIIASVPTGLSGDFSYTLDMVRKSVDTVLAVRLFETEIATTHYFTLTPLIRGVLVINDVEVTGSPFGAIATIRIPSRRPHEYSIDGINWQDSPVFSNLTGGNFTAYVRDPYGCTKTKSFQAGDDGGISLPGMIDFPINNSLRAVNRDGNIFLNFLAKETPGIAPSMDFFQEYLVGNEITQQFRSTYPSHTATLYDCHGNTTDLPIRKLSDNISRVNIYEGHIRTVEGQLAVYFTAGQIFNPDGSVQDFGHY